jgi:hypothetical protein
MESIMTILPLLIFSIIPLAFIGFIIWFAISILIVQKERNVILKEIANKLNQKKDGVSP